MKHQTTDMIGVSLLLLTFLQFSCQKLDAQTPPAKLLTQEVSALSLDDETIFAGLSHLNSVLDISISIERTLTPKQSRRLEEERKYTAQIRNVTLATALDWLCRLDGRYTWIADDTTINVLPVPVAADPRYVLNRRISRVKLNNIASADSAILFVVGQFSEPKEQLAVLEFGNLNFAANWTHEFADMTLRQILNRIAQQLGPTYGWQFSGTDEFRFVVFHKRLVPPATGGAREYKSHFP